LFDQPVEHDRDFLQQMKASTIGYRPFVARGLRVQRQSVCFSAFRERDAGNPEKREHATPTRFRNHEHLLDDRRVTHVSLARSKPNAR
jgi:hypothetical protein